MTRRRRSAWLAVVAWAVTSCGSDAGDDRALDERLAAIPTLSADERAAVELLRVLQRDLAAVRGDPMSEQQRAQLDAAEARVRRAVDEIRDLRRRGSTRGAVLARVGGVSAVLIADDATVVGAVDNGLLVLCGIAALAAVIATDGPAGAGEIAAAWQELHAGLKELEAAVVAATAASCPEPVVAAATVATAAGRPRAGSPPEPDSTIDVTGAPMPADAPRHGPNQKCTNAELDRLQRAMDDVCKGKGRDNSCSESTRSSKRLSRLKCSEVRRRLAKHRACLAARREVQECFRETDAGHARAIRTTARAIAWCEALVARQCASDSPFNDL